MPLFNDALDDYLKSPHDSPASTVFADAMIAIADVRDPEGKSEFRNSNRSHPKLCFIMEGMDADAAASFLTFLQSMDPNATCYKKDACTHMGIGSKTTYTCKFKLSNTPLVRAALFAKFKQDFLHLDPDTVFKIEDHQQKNSIPGKLYQQFSKDRDAFLYRQLISPCNTDILEHVLLNELAKVKTVPSRCSYVPYGDNPNLMHFAFYDITDKELDQFISLFRDAFHDRQAAKNDLIHINMLNVDIWVKSRQAKCAVVSIDILHKQVFPLFMQEVVRIRTERPDAYANYQHQSRDDSTVKSYELQLALYKKIIKIEEAIPVSEDRKEFRAIFDALKKALRGFDHDKTREAYRQFEELQARHPVLQNIAVTYFKTGFTIRYLTREAYSSLYFVSHNAMRIHRNKSLAGFAKKHGLFSEECQMSARKNLETEPVANNALQPPKPSSSL